MNTCMAAPGPAGGPGGFRITPQFVFGLLVITAGLLLTLDNFGIADASRFIRFWPAGLIAIGLVKLWQSRDGKGGTLAGILFAAVGTWLLLDELTVFRIEFRHLWPLLLVLFGAYLVWQGMSGHQRATRAAGGDSHSTLSAVAILGAVARGNNSRTFRGGDLTAVMGGCEIDLRHAQINGEAVFDVFAMWGGIDLRVPEDWAVESRIVPLLGGVDDKTRPPQGAVNHRLVLRGFAIMGGIEIKN